MREMRDHLRRFAEFSDAFHVVPNMEGVPSRQMDLERSAEVRKEAHQKLEKLEAFAGLDAPICVGGGNVAETICEEACRHEANLIVIGRGAS